MPVIIPQPQTISQSASSFSLKSSVQFFTSKAKKKKTKKLSKDLGDNATQILTGYYPNPNLGQYIHDIFIYDVFAKCKNITILDYLKAWDSVISVTVKKQKKYKTIQYKPSKLNSELPSRIKVSSGFKTGSSATGSNCVPIGNLLKDSSQFLSDHKTEGKNKKSQKMNEKSTGTSSLKKLLK
ncbi:hypothetical protein RclHR1_18050003 [Rhizophagus clarus]|uniref:Uncharacterized protein n=1 Tax=Rhizophagus clarus TaxID=94130 RepID=A0A2Z6RER4_9GLOM|nr:hypothetical protein RclHR1_18050003 [Rhizophagus clarus]